MLKAAMAQRQTNGASSALTMTVRGRQDEVSSRIVILLPHCDTTMHRAREFGLLPNCCSVQTTARYAGVILISGIEEHASHSTRV